MTSNPHTLVLGATGSIGYAVTRNLLQRGLPVTILVRSRAKAETLFPNFPTLTLVEGDAQDADLLKKLAADKAFIFHGINYPYHQWEGNMAAVTRKIIDAAGLPKATIVFPGNVYGYGLKAEPIREDSQPAPCSRKGTLRVELEQMLQEAAAAGSCRVLNVRMPDFWGPNVMNEGVRPIFENALTGKALPWLIRTDLPHQVVYTPDAAEAIVRLMLRPEPALPYELWNYGGEVLPSVRWFFEKLTGQTGQPLRTRIYSRFFVSVLGLFIPVLREVKEMLYLYENNVVLDDTKLRRAFPDFRETPLDEAIRTTLAWFGTAGRTTATPTQQRGTASAQLT